MTQGSLQGVLTWFVLVNGRPVDHHRLAHNRCRLAYNCRRSSNVPNAVFVPGLT